MNVTRRKFIKLSGTGITMGMIPNNTFASETELQHDQLRVNFTRDGLDLTPAEYSSILSQLADEGKIKADKYSRFGIVEELESKFATLLDKESAVFMPTGTLANHIAIRKLAGVKRRVIVQERSHIYNDSGDCVQTLSGINLLPLAPGKTGFSVADVKDALLQTNQGRVTTGIGAISIESPVRRKYNEMFSFKEMKNISDLAKENGIKLHLDGARLFLMPAHTGIPITDYTRMFDTVYVSLYKCFNAASGAILAGPKKITENLYHVRRMFGGGMPQVWPFAAIALHYTDSFIKEYSKALETAGDLFKNLTKNNVFEIKRIAGGTNVFKLKVNDGEAIKLQKNLLKNNIILLPPVESQNEFILKINPSINRISVNTLTDLFINSL